jgi:predicted lipid-binding transport protein (Tim44 family)
MRGTTLALAAGLLLTACGGSDAGGGERSAQNVATAPAATEAEQVANVANGLNDAVAAGDGELACSLVTDEVMAAMPAILAGKDSFDPNRSPDTIRADCEEAVEGAASSAGGEGGFRFKPRDISFSTSQVADSPPPGDRAYAACEFRGAYYLDRSGDSWKVSLYGCND